MVSCPSCSSTLLTVDPLSGNKFPPSLLNGQLLIYKSLGQERVPRGITLSTPGLFYILYSSIKTLSLFLPQHLLTTQSAISGITQVNPL